MTPAAERFVGPTTFAALSRRPVLTEQSADVFPHLEASREADALLHRPGRRQHDRAPGARRGAERADPVGAGVHRAAAGGPGHEPAHVGSTGHAGERARAAGARRRDDRPGVGRDGRGRAGRRPHGRARSDRRPHRGTPGDARQPGGAPCAGHRGRHPRAARRGPVPGQPLQRADGRGRGRRGGQARGRCDADPGCGHRIAECADAHAARGDGRAAASGHAGAVRRRRCDRDGRRRGRLPARPAGRRQAHQGLWQPGRSSWRRRPTSWPSWAPGGARARC